MRSREALLRLLQAAARLERSVWESTELRLRREWAPRGGLACSGLGVQRESDAQVFHLSNKAQWLLLHLPQSACGCPADVSTHHRREIGACRTG